MLYNQISANAIIGRALSSFNISDANIKYNALEWIGDCIELIGYHVGFVNKLEKVEVNFHKIPKPCDLFLLNFIVYNGAKLLHGRKPNLTRIRYGLDPLAEELVRLVDQKDILDTVVEDYNEDTCSTEIKEIQNLEEQRLIVKINALYDFVKRSDTYCFNDEYYLDGVNCFDTSIEKGFVYLGYKAFPLDEEGIPLVVDEVKYKNALEYYIMKKLTEGGYKHTVLSPEYIISESNKKIAQARNEHLKMSYAQMDNFVSKWTNMLFTLNPHKFNPYSNG